MLRDRESGYGHPENILLEDRQQARIAHRAAHADVIVSGVNSRLDRYAVRPEALAPRANALPPVKASQGPRSYQSGPGGAGLGGFGMGVGRPA